MTEAAPDVPESAALRGSGQRRPAERRQRGLGEPVRLADVGAQSLLDYAGWITRAGDGEALRRRRSDPRAPGGWGRRVLG